MYKDEFAKLNKARLQRGKPLFANPRNTAAGTIRQLDPQLVVGRPLHFRAYDLLRDNADEVPTHDFAYQALRGLGFLANKNAAVLKSIPDVMKFAGSLGNQAPKTAF